MGARTVGMGVGARAVWGVDIGAGIGLWVAVEGWGLLAVTTEEVRGGMGAVSCQWAYPHRSRVWWLHRLCGFGLAFSSH